MVAYLHTALEHIECYISLQLNCIHIKIPPQKASFFFKPICQTLVWFPRIHINYQH